MIDYKDILVRHTIKVDNSICYKRHLYTYRLEDSIHYQALLTNDYSNYERIALEQPEHSLEIFLDLQDNFDLEKIEMIKLEWNDEFKKWIVLDGCHRLSIMKHRNIELKEEYLNKV